MIEIASQKLVNEIKVGQVPEGIQTDMHSGNIYVANWGSNEVTVIDGETQKVISQIRTGEKSRAFGQFIMQDLNSIGK